MWTFVALSVAATALLGSSAYAGDQGLQAELQRLNCVPARIKIVDLAARMTAYEVTCKGAERVVTVVCTGDECRVQARAREDEQ